MASPCELPTLADLEERIKILEESLNTSLAAIDKLLAFLEEVQLQQHNRQTDFKESMNTHPDRLF